MRSRLGLAHAAKVAAGAVWIATGAAGVSAQTGALAATAPTFAGCSEGDGPPPPDQADCVARQEPPPPDFSWAPRAVFAVPRLAFRTATELLMIGPRLEDDHHVSRHADELFWNDERTFGVYPMLYYGTGIGGNVGLQLVHKDLAGHGEGLRLRAAYGAPYRQLYDAQVDSGARFGPVRSTLLVGYLRNDAERFYGLGNADEQSPSEVALPLDAQTAGPAVYTKYRVEQVRTNAAAEVPLARALTTRALHSWRIRQVSTGPSEDFDTQWVSEVFDPDTLVGWGPALVDAYSELSLILDTREALRADVPRELPGGGFRGQVWTGLQAGVVEPHPTFGRAGFDAQQFIDVFRGNRILRLRLRGATALGPVEQIPFLDVPSLGGSQLLRGYDTNRFRGRVTALLSAEYRYPIQESLAAYVFSDAGQVWPGWEDVSLASLRDVRVGFGAGLQVYSSRLALFRGQIASSIDGGVFLHLKVNTSDDFASTH
jgi:outer membrane protein assembly factor BamA